MSNIVLALEITALGMGLVFSAIVLLWWMMALLTSITAEKELTTGSPESVSEKMSAPVTITERRARAAAVAVAVALADGQSSRAHALSAPPTAIVSAWQLGMRTRHLSEKGTPIHRKPRKVG